MRRSGCGTVIRRRAGGSLLLCFTILAALCSVARGDEQTKLKNVQDLLSLSPSEPDFTIPYGEYPSQFGQLRLPEGAGPHPVAIIIHGGCWRAAFDLQHIGPLASAITGLGFATWSLEYRRIGNPGGGWPGTFLDVAEGVDFLSALSAEHDLDLGRVIILGHSAGGHLALWAAARHKLTQASPLFRPKPLPLQGVVSLAGVGDLSGLEHQKGCGDSAAQLMGGTREEFPLRYAQGSPIELLPLDLPQILVQGTLDPIILPEGARAYSAAASDAGDPCRLILIEDAGHFEVVIPFSSAWEEIRNALLGFL
jgi:acetyl esterase/lipase